MNRTKVAEKDRNNLSASKDEAQAYLDLERDIRRKQNVLYQVKELKAMQKVEVSGMSA